MAYEFIMVEKKDHLTQITINRPEAMNALHISAHKELDQAFEEFSNDPDAWVAILTGSGDRAFCVGNDLKWQAQHKMDEIMAGMAAVKGGFGGIVKRFDCIKPIIAAINGMALGGGFEIALACDIIIAAENALFGLPEVKVGLVAFAGGTIRLPRYIPYHQAMDLILSGRRIPAREAYRLGIVSEVVPSRKLISVARRKASEILSNAPLAVRASKEVVQKGLELPVKEAMEKEYPAMAELLKSEDLMEGPKAFAEKRIPQWKGR